MTPRDGAGCGGGRAAAGPHSLTMPGCDCRGGGGGGGGGGGEGERSGRSERAGSRRPAACTSAGARAGGSEGDTRTHTPAHAGAPRGEGRRRGEGRGGQPLTAAHVYTPGRPGEGAPLRCSPLAAALEAPRHQSPGLCFFETANPAAEKGPGAGRECPLWSRPAAGPDLRSLRPVRLSARIPTPSPSPGPCAARAGTWGDLQAFASP